MQEPSELREMQVSSERRVFPHQFQFPDRTVLGQVISCPHDTPEDTRFLLSNLEKVPQHPERTLFVEQGSGKQNDNLTKQLQDLAAKNPIIAQDFRERMANEKWSVADPKFNSDSPFALAADFWTKNNGKVVNMDLSSNLSSDALTYLLKTTSPEATVEYIYKQVKDACFSFEDTVPVILKSLLPQLPPDFIDKQCERLYPTYSHTEKSLDRDSEIKPDWYKLREAYMKKTLQEKMQENDIVLAHPNHIKNIL
jgi:hypothetical protein